MIGVYIRYKICMLRDSILRSSRQLRTYWDIFLAYFIFAVYMKIVYDVNSYTVVGIVSGIVLIMLTVWMDYSSGLHIHWNRERYKKKVGSEAHG